MASGRVNRWTVGGGAGKLVIIPRGKDVNEIIELLKSCFGQYDKQLYDMETSGSFDHFLVIRVDSRIVAMCSIYKKEGYIMFGRLCVAPDKRKQGFARLILDYLKSKNNKLVWTTNNPELDAFYTKMGGVKTGVKNGFVYWKWNAQI